MRSRACRLRFIWPSLLSAFFLVGLVACDGGGSRRSPSGALGSGEGGASVVIPRMEAKAMFFGGQIEAEALLARAGTHWSREDGSGRAGSRGAGGSGFGGHVGGLGGGRGGHRGGAGRGGSYGEGGSSDDQPRSSIYASNLPPAALRLRLTNHGDTPVEVQVIDFDSALGDFVVEPPTITLPPGQPVEAEPMVSRLGVGTTEIPLTVKLHLNGRSEQQVLTLRVVKEPAATPAPAGAAQAAASEAPPQPAAPQPAAPAGTQR